jgi:hypothetical protein
MTPCRPVKVNQYFKGKNTSTFRAEELEISKKYTKITCQRILLFITTAVWASFQ